MPLKRIEHYNIHPERLAETVTFYERVLGMKAGERPPFPFPGAWIYLEGTPVLHLVDIADGQRTARAGQRGTGVLDHIAFEAVDLAAMRATLTREGVAFVERLVPRTGVTQVFVEDPNGVTLELNFAETAAPAS
jgi:catechol 2,3-dioxygenase-like lactoylglutathione lyase family enzyme